MSKLPRWPLILLALGACQLIGDDSLTAAEASDIANAQLSEDLPQVSVGLLRIETQDLDTRWRVTYHAPDLSTGGPIVIDVDKQSREATLVFVGQ